TRSATPGCVRPRNARSPRKKPRSAPSAKRLTGLSATPPRRASAKKRLGEGETTTTARPGVRPKLEAEEESDGPRMVRRGPGGALRPAAPPKRPTRAAKTATERPRGRLTLVTALSADEVR